MGQTQILKGYEYAKAQFAALGIDVDAAIEKADNIPVSMHCWQGDDVIGFDGVGDLTSRLALMEARKTLPVGAVWDYYCMKSGMETDDRWLLPVKEYEKNVLSAR